MSKIERAIDASSPTERFAFRDPSDVVLFARGMLAVTNDFAHVSSMLIRYVGGKENLGANYGHTSILPGMELLTCSITAVVDETRRSGVNP